MRLREYQADAINALYEGWSRGLRRLGISAATGTGKTVIMSHLAHQMVQRGHRVLILVHRDELVRQTVDKLVRIDNSVSIGVVKAGENRGGASIVVASVDTVCRPKRMAQLGKFGLIICDEAHRSVAKTWVDTLTGLGAWAPDGPVCAGFSATWMRADKRALSDVWQEIVFELSTEWAISQGFLVRPVGQYIRTDIRLDQIKKTAGEYNAADLGEKLSRESVRDAIVTGYREHAADRSGVVFAPTVDTAEFFRAGFEEAGFTAEGLYGITPKDESRKIHDRHRRGSTQLLISCTRLSEGWDAPWCSAGVIARPTAHQGLFVQMVGRLLRPYEGKTNAVVLDPTGVLFKHKLEGVIDLSGSEPMERDPDQLEDEDQDPVIVGAYEGVTAEVAGYQQINLLAEGFLITHGGIPFSHISETEVAFAIGPTRHPYPWWSVGRMHLETGAGSWLATHLDEQAAISMLPSKSLTPNPMIRSRRATMKQRRIAAEKAKVYGSTTRQMTAGQVFDLVQTQLASTLLDAVQSWA